MKIMSALLLILAVGLSGCTVTRDLKITEVGLREVELYLDEPTANRLALDDHKLMFISSSGDTDEVLLFGSIGGGKYIVVWEDPNYNGVPVDADYINYFTTRIRGIKVPNGFFGAQSATDTFAYRIYGTHNRGFVTDKVKDVVKFGPYDPAASPPVLRPQSGGVFTEDGSLKNEVRAERQGLSKARTISRKWNSGAPQDTDSENDWKGKSESFGSATP